MTVPACYTSRTGRVFRLKRFNETNEDGARYILRGSPLGEGDDIEVSQDSGFDRLRDQISRKMVLSTPEEVFESLWQQLRLDLDGK